MSRVARRLFDHVDEHRLAGFALKGRFGVTF